MMDFLKAFPSLSKDEYMWDWTIPQLRLALADNTHVEYLSEEQAKIDKARRYAVEYSSGKDLANDLGCLVFGK